MFNIFVATRTDVGSKSLQHSQRVTPILDWGGGKGSKSFSVGQCTTAEKETFCS